MAQKGIILVCWVKVLFESERYDLQSNMWGLNFGGYIAKSQGTCGSCAAFASTGAFETCMLKAGASKTNLDLSEQWLLNCAYQTTAFPQFK